MCTISKSKKKNKVSSCRQDSHTDSTRRWVAWLWASAGKSTWGKASTPQVGLYHAQGDCVGTQSPTWTTPISGHGQQCDICFPSYYQVPIDATAGWAASPVHTHTHTHTDTHTHTHTHTRARMHTYTQSCTHSHTHTHTHTHTRNHAHINTHRLHTHALRFILNG